MDVIVDFIEYPIKARNICKHVPQAVWELYGHVLVSMYLLIIIIFLLRELRCYRAFSVSGNQFHSIEQGDQQGRNETVTGLRRTAVFWVFSYGAVPYYFDMSVGSLLGAGASNVDIHIIVPVRSTEIDKYINGSMANKQVIVHIVTPAEWKKRAVQTFGVAIPFETDDPKMSRKMNDFKPTLGLLFQDFIPRKIYAHWIYGDNDGIFGSYDNMFDFSALRNYDVVAGSSVTINGKRFKGQLDIQPCTGNKILGFHQWKNVAKLFNAPALICFDGNDW